MVVSVFLGNVLLSIFSFVFFMDRDFLFVYFLKNVVDIFKYEFEIDSKFFQVYGFLYFLGFDYEISEEAEEEMEKEEELFLKGFGWKGKGLIKSVYDVENNGSFYVENFDGKFVVLLIFFFNEYYFLENVYVVYFKICLYQFVVREIYMMIVKRQEERRQFTILQIEV